MDRARRVTVRALLAWATRAVRWTWRVLGSGRAATPAAERVVCGWSGDSPFCLSSPVPDTAVQDVIRAAAQRRFERGALFVDLGRLAAAGVVVGARIREEKEGIMIAEHVLVIGPHPGDRP
jgi:hypothetical protein